MHYCGFFSPLSRNRLSTDFLARQQMQHQMTMMTMQPPHPQQMPGGSLVPNMGHHAQVVGCASAPVVVHAFPVAAQQHPPAMTRQGP